jgi:hypothetical protein
MKWQCDTNGYCKNIYVQYNGMTPLYDKDGTGDYTGSIQTAQPIRDCDGVDGCPDGSPCKSAK